MKPQSFLHGAIILAVAGVLSRLLGMLWRFFLPYFLSDEGLGLYQMAYPIYTTLLGLSAMGIPVAISKLVAEKLARNDGKGAMHVFRVAFLMLTVVGLAFSLILVVIAPTFARSVLKETRATYTILAIAPAIFVVSLMSAYRGLFQGFQQMSYHAMSQIVEQVVRVITIFALVLALIPYGTTWQAAGASFGAVTGGVGGLLYLAWAYMRLRPSINEEFERRTAHLPTEPSGTVMYRILELAIPVSLASIILPIVSFIDSVVVPSRLHVAGFAAQATAMYGVLTAKAMPFVTASTVFTAALAVSLVPAISESLARGDNSMARSRARTGVRVTFLINLPASVGLFLLAYQVPDMLWHSPEVGRPLAILTAAMLFLAIQQTTSGILQGMGRPDIPVRNLVAGAAIKVAVTYYLTGIPHWNIAGAALGSVLGFLTAASLNLTAVHIRLGEIFNAVDMIVRPGVAVLIMSVAVKFAYSALLDATASNAIATLLSIGVGVLVYGVGILVVGGVRSRDLNLIPVVGPWAVRILKSTGLLRD